MIAIVVRIIANKIKRNNVFSVHNFNNKNCKRFTIMLKQYTYKKAVKISKAYYASEIHNSIHNFSILKK
jgi:hypothetical protein